MASLCLGKIHVFQSNEAVNQTKLIRYPVSPTPYKIMESIYL